MLLKLLAEGNKSPKDGIYVYNDGKRKTSDDIDDDKDGRYNSLAYFKDLDLTGDKGSHNRKLNSKRSKRKYKQKTQVKNFADSSDESSDDDDDVLANGSDEESFPDFCVLSPKFRHIIKHQVGPAYMQFFKPLALQVATKADLSETTPSFGQEFSVLAHFAT